MQASLPTTGVAIPVFAPKSLSLSTQMTSNLLAVVALISLASLLF
jgi:hypothetical protein